MVLRSKLAPIAALAAALALGTAAPAFAVDGEATITGTGAVSMTAADDPVFAATLNGTDQQVTDSFDITLEDSRGTGAGWDLWITSTRFATAGGTHSLSNSAAAITGVSASCVNGATCSAPDNEVTWPLTVPADTAAPSAEQFFSATADSGMGKFTVAPTMRLTVPANAYAGAYTSTVTLTTAQVP
jgi:hypothetical protein